MLGGCVCASRCFTPLRGPVNVWKGIDMINKKRQYRRSVFLRGGGLMALLALAGSVQAADNSAAVTASVTVLDTESCTITVSPTSHAMAMTWSRNAEGVVSYNVTSSTEPVNVTLRATGGNTCTLNNLTLRTEMGSGIVPGPDSGKQNFTFKKSVGSQGGFWRFMPYLARAQFYTDEQQTQPGTGKITWNGPSEAPYNHMVFGDTATIKGTEVLDMESMGGDVVFLTDQYVEDGGALLIDKGVNEGTFTSSVAGEKYRSAVLGFGALMATAPENVNGTRAPELAAGGDQVTMTWTVYIDQA